MLAERAELAKALQTANKSFADGKTTRRKIADTYGKRIEQFEAKYRSVAEDAWFKVVDKAPSAYEVFRTWHDVERPPQALSLKMLYFFGYAFDYDPPTPPAEETGSVSQGLDGIPPPNDQSFSSYTLKIDQEHYSNVISFAYGYAYPAIRYVSTSGNAGTYGLIPGACGARALLGAEFMFPAGYTEFSISADLDWNCKLMSGVLLGGAGCGVDLLVRVEPAGGASPTEKVSPLRSCVAPAMWSRTVEGASSSTVSLSMQLDGAAPRSIKVFAGVAVHAEAEGVMGAATVNAGATVTKLSVHAE
jgi:hypothetical protein